MRLFSSLFFLFLSMTLSGQKTQTSKPVAHLNLKTNDPLILYLKNLSHTSIQKMPAQQLAASLKKINQIYIDSGYIFNRIIPDSIIYQNRKYAAFFHMERNKKAKIDSIIFIKKKLIPANFRLYLRKKYRQKTLNHFNLLTLRNDINTSFFCRLKENPFISFEKGKNYVVAKLSRLTTNQISGNLGFIYQSKLKILGSMTLKIHNTFNLGESMTLRWHKDENNQNLFLKTGIAYIAGQDLTGENTLFIEKLDSTKFSLTNEAQFKYNFKQNSLGVSFLWQNYKSNQIKTEKNYMGIYYAYTYTTDPKFRSKIALKIDGNPSNLKEYTTLLKIFNKLIIKPAFWLKNRLYWHQNNSNLPTNLISKNPEILRKNSQKNVNYKTLFSLQNDLIFIRKKTNIYLITDYIIKNYKRNVEISYVNTGIGMQFRNKKQILTLELIQPINIDYIAVYQGFYLNIKETILF